MVFITVLLPLFILSGCSSTQFNDLFTGYAPQMSKVRLAQQQGQFIQAQSLVKKRDDRDSTYALGLLELGRLQFLEKQWPLSQKTFAKAYQSVEKTNQQAKIKISKGVENVGAVFSNDNALTYEIPLYEQSMLHSYQSLNYLYQHDLEGALVEIRRANLVQIKALSNNKQKINSALNKMKKQGVNLAEINDGYPSMEKIIGEVKNGFQNAYTFYLSALLYEAAGQANDAYIDYKRALEIYPDNRYIQQDVWRLALKLNMSVDVAGFKQKFSTEVTTLQPIEKKAQGQLAIIVEKSIIHSKQAFMMNLPIYRQRDNVKFYSIAIPVYKEQPNTAQEISLVIDKKRYDAQEIVRLQSLAAKELQDHMPAIVSRQILRLIAKEEVRKKITKQAGDFGNILATIYNVASEKADTRSWNTLPASIDILKTNMSIGKHTINLSVGGRQQNIDVDIQPNRITLINLTSMNHYTGYQVINL